MPFTSFAEFVTPVDFFEISGDEAYEVGQIGQLLQQENDVETAQLVIVGCNEWRGAGPLPSTVHIDAIRKQLYQLFYWHQEVKIADIGTINTGAKITDSFAALKLIVSELLENGKKVVVIGGSHDNTLALYQCFAERQEIIEATVVDALFDLEKQNPRLGRRFLLDMLTTEPNFIRHFNLIGFQSYFAYPDLMEIVDKLRFDCFRVGKVQERLEEVEPVIRASQLLSIDINAIAYAFAPANTLSPNGFTGQEMCKLMQYAGMSESTRVTGIFNMSGKDHQNLTALQIAQMLWYFIDGMQRQLHESPLEERHAFNEYHTLCAEVDTLFLQSKNSNRWWMQMPDGQFIPCSISDYMAASNNDLPERWLRTQERM